tara:strand:+ start:291 stop:431 length:141 start_codon:yes stop_codon:yes gene_type:complete
LQVDYNDATGAAKLEPEEPAPKALTLTDIEIEDEQKKIAAKKEKDD